MTSRRSVPIRLERLSRAESVSQPSFHLISAEKMERVSQMARRHLSKLRERHLLEEFLREQNYNCANTAGGPVVAATEERVAPTADVVKKPAKTETGKIPVVRSKDNGLLLREVTGRIRRLIHEMDTPAKTSEDGERRVLLNEVLSLGVDQHSNKLKRLQGQGTVVAQNYDNHNISRAPSRQMSMRKPMPTAQKNNGSLKASSKKVTEDKSPVHRVKLPPYQLRKQPVRLNRFVRNASTQAKPKISLDVSSKGSISSRLGVDSNPDDVGEPTLDTVSAPSNALYSLWHRLLTIELEDQDVEHNLIALKPLEIRLPTTRSTSVDHSEYDFSIQTNSAKPIVVGQHFREEIIGNEARMDEPHVTRYSKVVVPAVTPNNDQASPGKDERTLIKGVPNEMIEKLLDELSSDFMELPKAILKELLEGEFLEGNATSTR